MDPTTKSDIEKSLFDLACEGLRTLCVAHKKLSQAEAKTWLESWKAASTSIKDRAEKLDLVAAELEVDMNLLGITAIEDRLQEDVPEVIADLAKAGIILWMLTGDKEETAVQIGRSCNLFESSTEIFFITSIRSENDYISKLEEVYTELQNNYIPGVGYRKTPGDQAKEVGLVMDGPSFRYFNEQSEVQRGWLLKIGQSCRSVVACRLTPVQKQMLVNIVKTGSVPRAITLAIGDGANDVSMIREADVGVGIIGKEGRQAANNADFAIGQFKFLRKLLLVHGRWNYIRQSKAFLYCMHKNMVITLTLFWFSYYTSLSGQSIYESWVYSGFNLALGLPIIFFGIMDRDIPAEFAIKFPQVYRTGRTNSQLSTTAISRWIVNAVAYAYVFCLIFYESLSNTFKDYGIWEFGTIVFCSLVFSLSVKAVFYHHQINKYTFWGMLISIVGTFIYILVISVMDDDFTEGYYGVGTFTFGQGLFWLYSLFAMPIISFVLDLSAYAYYLFFDPPRNMIYHETSLNYYSKNRLKSNSEVTDGISIL